MLFAILAMAAMGQNAALYLDGSGDYASFPNMLNAGMGGATGFTFETWIKPASLANGSPIDNYRNTIVDFSITGINSVLAMYLREDGKIRFGGRSRNLDAFQDVVTGSPVVVTDTWQHVAGVLDFTNKKIFLYVDGNLVASKEIGVNFTNNTFATTAGGTKLIGASIGLNADHFFHGAIEETRFWTTPRTQHEIQENMDYPVSTQPYLLAYWKYDNNMEDSSGYGFTGSIFGNASYGETFLSGLYIYVVPVFSEVYEDDYVELEIRVEGFQEPLRAYEISLNYDTQYLRLEDPGDIRPGDLLSAHGLTQLFSTGEGGEFTVTESILGVSSGATGSGSLFIIKLRTLEPTDDAGTPFNLGTAILRGPLNEDVLVADLLGSTIVIEERPLESHIIPLHTGWNLVSSWIVPQDSSIEAVFAQLVTDGYLQKVQDEYGQFYLYDSVQGWVNTIGTFYNTEGYYVKVNADCFLVVTGQFVELPLVVDLHAGWNLIPYPYTSPVLGMNILQPLITTDNLKKVQDEYANLIFNDNGTWVDNIGDFESGEGYSLRVDTDSQIEYTETLPILGGTASYPAMYRFRQSDSSDNNRLDRR